jgi:uncharacterized protein (DUF983 family)
MQFLIVLPLTIALIAAALWLDETFRPPLWAQALIWVPLVPLTMTAALRLVKTTLLMVMLRRNS